MIIIKNDDNDNNNDDDDDDDDDDDEGPTPSVNYSAYCLCQLFIQVFCHLRLLWVWRLVQNPRASQTT